MKSTTDETVDTAKDTGAPQQEAPMKVEAQKEHHWLQKMVGTWTCESEATVEPGKPPSKWKGTETVRPLGEIWVLAEGQQNEENNSSCTGITMMTLGYDPQKKRFVGTFIGSMMTNMWLYEGTLDAAEKVLTLDTEGPSMSAEGKLTKYKDVIEFKSDNDRRMTSEMLGEDGKWQKFMTATYRRVK